MSGEPKQLGNLAGVLLIVLAGLTLSILAFDSFLWEVAFLFRVVPLSIFIVIHLVLAGLVLARRVGYKPILIWAALLFVLGAGDVASAPLWYEGEPAFAAFANYLFNPLDTSGQDVGNPPGIPALPVDLMMAIYLILVGLSIRARRLSNVEKSLKK
ncbi:MAG: hypothetical protein ACE5KG_00100 [Nitrososphaerales archaeon]